MAWNFHQYYTNRNDGLMGKLVLTDEEKDHLKALRKIIRLRTRDVFEEAKGIAKAVKNSFLTLERIQEKVVKTKIKHLSDSDQLKVAKLIHEMDDDARDEFLELTPRFWTQGSFQYDTLNRPFQPGQEMDIDDGTYMPMPIFESEPKIGHSLLILLVDASLKSLVAENQGWKFEAKQTCGRIKIEAEKTHIDVPMYAIPKDEFMKKQVALKANRTLLGSIAAESYAYDSDDIGSYEVDSENVNLALRDGERKWTNSDPKIVEDWFQDSCVRIGKHLRKICRFMKAWRDAQWDVGGPSSISLMAATVNILDSVPHKSDDLGETMRIVAENLPHEFARGIDSPDDTDEKPLFPPSSMHERRELGIMDKLEQLSGILRSAESADSKSEALRIINTAFGNRVTNSELIVSVKALPAFSQEPVVARKPEKISSTMVSG
ncbi:CBASS cGAMP synthase [Vibrio europaeus]|uniref:CBASS cGAMP synthase n=1 Tax=Vibrio europaeus TaxID=300876 RepID=UPI00233E771E|nr:CBASS cGAMP synthase [Vibrio europaeus]MDC5753747.1 CBASS cGAMP synthase [Vibrio europaeus]MDC5778340.1 CBASS cGAMP synthase [Vibrio europaeus]MDC5793620.1 CBASS cGAMP synthase [Vibrio europaeus]MDC5798927.1 CBASS cGAMP synthase [Vibrio europaeus]MDC5815039.1 CBASS cGAMP synthase [Vibrio europaeus]